MTQNSHDRVINAIALNFHMKKKIYIYHHISLNIQHRFPCRPHFTKI